MAELKKTLNDIREEALLGGGKQRIEKQHEKGIIVCAYGLRIAVDHDCFIAQFL